MAVELYIVRHAIAADRGPDWPDDAQRPLTERGIDRFRDAVRGLVAIGLDLDLVLTSPLVRARQTAEYLAEGLPSPPALAIADTLAPGHGAAEVMEEVARETGGRTRVAVVGHEPGVGQLAAYLVGTRRAIPFKKGGVCRIDMDTFSTRGGILVWLATPRMLRTLAK